MAKTDYQSVDHYISEQPEASRTILETVRAALRTALPEAKEVISYQIPAYKIPEGTVIFFAGWKKHFSVYPIGEKVPLHFATELARYEMDKGTIRFPLTDPVPVELIGRIARIRAEEVAERKKAKKS